MPHFSRAGTWLRFTRITAPALLILACFLILALGADSGVSAQSSTPPATYPVPRVPPNGFAYRWDVVTDALDLPILVTSAHDGSGRLFVAEQAGVILIVRNGQLAPTPFLDIFDLLTDEVSRGGYTERGLLGVAFHPDFEHNGVFFINYVNRNAETTLARYRVRADNPDQADPASAMILLTLPQPFENHNGGHLAFGPDGYLYMATGDGGGMGDPLLNGQKTDTLHGKLLRLDVGDLEATTYRVPPDNPFVGDPAYRPEIWALGLRNPWRYSFDRLTGDLYIADVGQWRVEEIDFQPAGSRGGENYGWNTMEGDIRYDEAPPDAPILDSFVAPVAVYDHTLGCSVTGGYVYRGRAYAALYGVYLYGDYCNGRMWALYQDPDGTWNNVPFMDTGHQITSFGEDETGELYMVDYKGVLLKLTTK